MNLNQPVFIFRGLAIGVIVLLSLSLLLHQKNKQLTESHNRLLLQNDSVLSVNLQLQKDLNFLKHDLDSVVRSNPDKQHLTNREIATRK
ncbi:hypothetical protein [Niastella populi]|uniref:Uncharacterized protein n=1 Tax=Niastella populi TaxID=550983 RepID=A0A1V9FJC9_9BACT|nr:hypothetical protein [Niastella populi]OQP58465.1 hypothetical protein A4R26_03140 [Niastella populi]